jgi:hypothetical protein
MNRRIPSWAATLLSAVLWVALLWMPLVAGAAPPQPGGATAGVEGPSDPLAPLTGPSPADLAPLTGPSPADLAPLTGSNTPEDPLWPLTGPKKPKISLFFRVAPEAPKPCPGDEVSYVIWVGQGPPGTTLQRASDGDALSGAANAKVTVAVDGKTVATLRTNAQGLVQPEWKWTAKKGKHTLSFAVTPPSSKYQGAAPISRSVDVKTCEAKLTLDYKESVIIPKGTMPNELTIKLEGTVKADDDGVIAATDMTGSFDTLLEPHAAPCTLSISGGSGSFDVSVSGQASEDTFDLDLTGGSLNYGPLTATGTCGEAAGSKTTAVKSVDAINLMKLASLSFSRDGGSQSFSLPKAIVWVGKGTQYAEGTVSLEPEDDEDAGGPTG